MTTPQSTATADRSLGRDVLNAARYYLGNRWILVGLASLAVIAGLSFGGWGWLVAAGLAPIILSALPCLVMCGFGVCMMCRSNKAPSTAPRDVVNATTSSSALSVAEIDRSSTLGGSSCCHEQADEAPASQVKQLQPAEERRDSHA
ncbi:MAG: hypothetical protein ABIL01_19730 [Pseudomonadota bacterium]